jgi:glycosyltransferase involved in cell wall biosynthesis
MTETTDISIVLVVHDQAGLLRENLPSFLNIDTKRPYDVIVVDDQSTDDTPDVLKLLKADHPHLYSTFLPTSVIYNPSRLRLALTVGVKASKSRRIVFADISRPFNSESLSGLANSEGPITMVYTGRKPEKSSIIFQAFDSLDEATNLILKAERRSGSGHRRRFFKYRRGIYTALSVDKGLVFPVINLFDQRISGFRLWALRFSVFFHNLF